MVEATVSLKKGGDLIVISESWAELMETLKGYEITGINARAFGEAGIRPGQKSTKENDREDRCICCGEAIPEGRQICPSCEKKGGRKK